MQLEVEHRIIDLSRPYLFYILLRPHLVGVLMIIRNASAEHDSLEVQLLAEFLTVFVHTSAEAEAAVVGMDEHFDAVENVTFGIMGVECLVAGHLLIGVVVIHHVIVDDDAQCTAHDLIVSDAYHLTFWKDIYEFLDLFMCPENIVIGVDTMERACKLVVI